MRWILIVIAGLAGLVSLAAWGPGSWAARRLANTPPGQALQPLFEPVREPLRTERTDLHGAEDLEPGPDGRLYASLADGRIMARDPALPDAALERLIDIAAERGYDVSRIQRVPQRWPEETGS